MTEVKTFTKNVENIEGREGENTAALCTVVFVLSSKNHRRGLRSATYRYSLIKKRLLYAKRIFFLQSKLIELQMVFSQKCKFP